MTFKRKKLNQYLFKTLLVGIYTFILAPIFIIIVISFDSSASFLFPPKALSLRWFISFFTNETFMTSFFKISLPLAICTALASTPLGILGAFGLVRYSFKGKSFMESYLILPMLVPHVILGVALLLFFLQLDLKATFFSLLMGHVALTIPFVVRTVSASLHGVSPRLEEAARILGAARVQTFFRVTLPLIRSGIISGALFCFIISFGEITLTLFLAGPRTTTIPVHIFSEIQWQGDPTIAAISAIQILIIGVILILVNRLFKIRMAL